MERVSLSITVRILIDAPVINAKIDDVPKRTQDFGEIVTKLLAY